MFEIQLKPINSRFKRLIHDFGDKWITISEPKSMSCFGGENGITCTPINNSTKISNFKSYDVISNKSNYPANSNL